MVLPKMHSFARLSIVVGLALSILLGPLVADVSAQEANEAETRLSIKPVNVSGSYFELTMSPGETRQIEVELANLGEETVDARAFAADAYTIINGGLGVRLDGEPTSGATHWLDYPAETLTLEPGAAIVRTIEVSVPDDVTPGEYLTALVIQNAVPTGADNSGGVSVKQVNRQAIAVAIDVPGERAPELTIGSAEHLMVAGLSVIRTGVENPGNVRLRPSGEFTLIGPDGAEISRLPIAMDSVYAGTDTRIEVSLPELLPAGDYTVSLWLEDSEYGARAEAQSLLVSIPVLEAPQQIPAPAPVTDPATEPAATTQTTGIPTWAVLAAIPAAVILGALIATGCVLGIRRRSNGSNTPQPAAISQHVVTREVPPPAPARKQATVRQMTPPSRANQGNPSISQGNFD